MAELKIERIGGFAGFGLPRSHLRSRGSLDYDLLSDADKKQVEGLFATGGAKDPATMRDGIVCRLTWQSEDGSRTIEVPEALVPNALTATIHDEIE